MFFWDNIDTPLGFFTFFCAILVVFVNGWTDAPSALFSVVASKTLKLWQGAILSAIFNFLGVFLCSLIGGKVAESIFSLASLQTELEGSIICISCFLSVIIFGVVAWLFGMPSSESHALISSLAGASLALGGFRADLIIQILKILLFMVLSCVLSYFLSFGIAKLFLKRKLPFKGLLIFGCASLSFMHGGQDGQKFIAIMMFLLGVSQKEELKIPFVLVALVSIVMSLSTLLGGKKIINSLSKSVENLDTPLAFSSDLGSFVALGICSVLGMPVSTGNIKSLSIVGAGASQKKQINKKIITEILLTSVITFPICFLLGFFICKTLFFVI
ncbi:MAG: inorganic phosphate transporter [Clostridia bacterium]|nr:inorganic phosphate transporter [Clostridia bacterium]